MVNGICPKADIYIHFAPMDFTIAKRLKLESVRKQAWQIKTFFYVICSIIQSIFESDGS